MSSMFEFPTRPLLREIGHAHVTALASRQEISGVRVHDILRILSESHKSVFIM